MREDSFRVCAEFMDPLWNPMNYDLKGFDDSTTTSHSLVCTEQVFQGGKKIKLFHCRFQGCSKSYQRLGRLEEHERVHSGEVIILIRKPSFNFHQWLATQSTNTHTIRLETFLLSSAGLS
eukprot:Sdes_comp20690_c0_seq2m16234